ncbi:hypothetical protein MA05_00185 [Comamonas aquatica]|nr:hypothetical protein MA05_00185 [Comamonas aquatica]
MGRSVIWLGFDCSAQPLQCFIFFFLLHQVTANFIQAFRAFIVDFCTAQQTGFGFSKSTMHFQ